MFDKKELARKLLLLINKGKDDASVEGKYCYEMEGKKYTVYIDDSDMEKLVNLSVDIVEQLLLLPNAGLDANKFHKLWKEAIHIACASGEFDPYKMSDVMDKYLNEELNKLVDCVPLIMKKSKVLYSFRDKPLIVLAIFKAYSRLVRKIDEHEQLMAAYLILCIILGINCK